MLKRNAEDKYLTVNNILKSCKLGGVVAPLTTKWVYTMKSDGKGNNLKGNAPLVLSESLQVICIDYEETFSPVTRLESFRLVLAIAVQLCSPIHHMDVKAAFLNCLVYEHRLEAKANGLQT